MFRVLTLRQSNLFWSSELLCNSDKFLVLVILWFKCRIQGNFRTSLETSFYLSVEFCVSFLKQLLQLVSYYLFHLLRALFKIQLVLWQIQNKDTVPHFGRQGHLKCKIISYFLCNQLRIWTSSENYRDIHILFFQRSPSSRIWM